MQAIVYRTYGSADVLAVENIDKPTPKDDEVLIRVRAASVNPLDWRVMRASPHFIRLMTGLGKPKDPRLGVDAAGTIDAVGRNVTGLKPGDDVVGVCRGAFAEFARAAASAVVAKPANVTFEQAAALPIAACTALQGLRDKGRIQPGQKVLINGAAGGVGTFAVQIAKSLGADVTGVCSSRNVEMVRTLGAHRVIDYLREDFTQSGQLYDAMLDCVANHPLSACRRILNPKGAYLLVGGHGGPWLGPLARSLQALVWSPFVSQSLYTVMAKSSATDLLRLLEMVETGKITPVIDRRYRLSEVPQAIRYLEEGHARGKVIITVTP